MEMWEKIDLDSPVLTIDKTIVTLRNHSMTWLWNTFNAVNTPDLVKKDKENLDEDNDHRDDSSMGMSTVVSAIVSREVAGSVSVSSSGGLVSKNGVDDINTEPVKGESKVQGDDGHDKTIPTTVKGEQTQGTPGTGEHGQGK
ncbi:hypothetical protein F5148DRAFT_1148832 [Russula earlei]|uniref:Uncharacterized protein n=1 Tax=Russula earlei TaxID=71964 RepID=A0ACC0UB36_9AGAM|nr:hypothetical protein F5148DRAFT_1148832 [Russula earlei]